MHRPQITCAACGNRTTGYSDRRPHTSQVVQQHAVALEACRAQVVHRHLPGRRSQCQQVRCRRPVTLYFHTGRFICLAADDEPVPLALNINPELPQAPERHQDVRLGRQGGSHFDTHFLLAKRSNQEQGGYKLRTYITRQFRHASLESAPFDGYRRSRLSFRGTLDTQLLQSLY